MGTSTKIQGNLQFRKKLPKNNGSLWLQIDNNAKQIIIFKNTQT